MGLLYIMPINESEADRVEILEDESGKTIILRSYGLPMIFWGYFAAIIIILLAMSLTIMGPHKQMINQDDAINKLIAYLVISTLIGMPFLLLCFLLYEKFISKNGPFITVSHRLFWISFYKKSFELCNENTETDPNLFVEKFLDSPNIAKMEGDSAHRAFQNQGHFYLKAKRVDLSVINLDRHSRRTDLNKICKILAKY